MTRADVIAYLEGLDAHALGELVDELQRRLGLPPPASPPRVAMGAPMPMGVPDEDEYRVVLLGFTDARKIDLLRLVRELRPLGLLEAKRLVESAPVTFQELLTRRDADDLADRLRAAGARVEVRR